MKKWIDYIWVAVGMVLVNDEWAIFLAQRWPDSKNEAWKRECTWWWVEHGESREDAVVREAKEEFGVEVKVVDTIGVFDHIIPAEWHHRLSTTYLCEIQSGIPKILEPRKCTAIKWVKENEVDMNELSEMAKMAIGRYREKYS